MQRRPKYYDSLKSACRWRASLAAFSPTPDEEHYTAEGEFCLKNPGRLLCETLGRCGVWNCRPGDFMCPRHEYNKQWTRFRGFGDCSAAARPGPAIAALAAALTAALSLLAR